jgi:hypothetical protein
MKHALMSAIALAFLLMLPEPLAAPDLASSIVGTWKLTSFVRKEMATDKSATTYGEHPSGYAYYTKGATSYLRGGPGPQKEREDSGPHGRGTY